MFAFHFAIKYLLPRRKNQGLFFLTLFSGGLIAFLTWLVLLFFSISEGVESRWIGKLTNYCPPIRIEPTPLYFNSYDYLIDRFSSASSFQTKSLEEKSLTAKDPYRPENDPELPLSLEEFSDKRTGIASDLLTLVESNSSFSPSFFTFGAGMVRIELKDLSFLTTLSHFLSDEKLKEESDGIIPLILPNSFLESGVQKGNKIIITIGSLTPSSIQQEQLFARVVDFYDPGLFGAAFKPILAPKSFVRMLSTNNAAFTLPENKIEGIALWPKGDLSLEKEKKILMRQLQEQKLDSYFTPIIYYEAEPIASIFAEFQADKALFGIVAFLMLLVASCSVVATMVLLVQERKAQLALIASFGLSKSSLFGMLAICASIVTFFSLSAGTLLAFGTLSCIDPLTALLWKCIGGSPFPASIFGSSLTASLSFSVVTLLWGSTFFLSLIASFFATRIALKMAPAEALRSSI